MTKPARKPLTETARQLLFVILNLPGWHTPAEWMHALSDDTDKAAYLRILRALTTLRRRGLIACRPTTRNGATLEYNRLAGEGLAAACLVWMREATAALEAP